MVSSGDVSSGDEASGAAAVEEWRTLWSGIYGRSTSEGEEGALNLAGWISSYTGRPIAEREMQEWVDRTVERIRELKPRRLLEIGCGMGLLLARLAPACEECWGIDFSPEAVAYVERALAGRLPVTVLRKAADDLDGLPPGTGRHRDPQLRRPVLSRLSYLRRVLAGLVALAAPGARIFLGGRRSLPLLSTFHLSVLLQQADAATPLAEIRQQVETRVSRERELVLNPAFFFDLGREADIGGMGGSGGIASIGGIAGVEVQLKRGRARNELTRFRYDVTLTLAGAGRGGVRADLPVAAPGPWVDWRKEGLSWPALRRLLADDGAPPCLAIRGVPNARLLAEVEAESLLHGGDPGLATVADLQEAYAAAARAGDPPACGGVEPEDFWALCRDLPYRVGVHWGESPGILRGGSPSPLKLVPARPVV